MKKNMNTADKMRIFEDSFSALRAKGIVKTYQDFANILGVSKNSISEAKNGNERYLTESLISKIQGFMREQDRSVQVVHSPGSNVVNGDNNNVEFSGNKKMSAFASPYHNMRCVPTIPIHAYRAVNFDVMEYFNETHDDLRMSPIVMQFPGTDCYYFVNSEDMSPNLRTNDLLCLSRLPDEAKVTNGDICIVNTKFQGILERFVYDDGDCLILKAAQPRWTDMRIPKDEIFNIFRILGGIRTNI